MHSDLAPRDRIKKMKTGFTLNVVMLVMSSLLLIATRQLGNVFGVVLFGFFAILYYRQMRQIEQAYPQVASPEKSYSASLKKR